MITCLIRISSTFKDDERSTSIVMAVIMMMMTMTTTMMNIFISDLTNDNLGECCCFCGA